MPTESALDNMLDSLTRDLQELGITAAPAGVCAACRKPIAGKVSPCQHLALQACPWNSSHSPCASSSQVLTALGKTWHPEHFTCAHCGRELDKGPFFEQGGRAFCEEDYHQAFSPRCAYCAGPIREVSEPPASPATHQPGPSPRLFLQKVLTALEQTWHPEHFFCAHCGKMFGDEGMSQGAGVGVLFPSQGSPALAHPTPPHGLSLTSNPGYHHVPLSPA